MPQHKAIELIGKDTKKLQINKRLTTALILPMVTTTSMDLLSSLYAFPYHKDRTFYQFPHRIFQ
jgi:hypothetical protein